VADCVHVNLDVYSGAQDHGTVCFLLLLLLL
jgi:hypothetical protein